MASLSEVKSILEEALVKEKQAEENCAQLLQLLHENGYPQIVEKIKNDEIHHQQIVKDLLGNISAE